ncbi:MAG: 2-oxoacid:acceptor oxidoreductase subunit alpha [Bacteroidales bacterium]|nr:2-oxoacid:acceptor oxidoreductase subunit alpha [Bacteroidales bacterium]
MSDTAKVTSLEQVVIRFSGDSGDGMQLTGSLFSNLSAIYGNEISTFPDFPAEIRAPQGSLSGVSGYQLHIGSKNIHTPGDLADVLIAMNPAALKVNSCAIKSNAIVIADQDSFDKNHLEKAGFVTEDPFEELQLKGIQLILAPISSMVKDSLAETGMDNKSILRSKNMFALGLLCWLFNADVEQAKHLLENKFKKKPAILQANLKVLQDGFNYGHNTHSSVSTYHIDPTDLPKGTYTDVKGNQATAWGLIAASEKSGLPLFLGSYPITPATEILQELAARKDLGVKTVQAEDEIAGICTAIGASFAGSLAATSTSGPGLALKSEAIGLAVMAELPLVVVNVQRGGPSTGLPTKTEQSDLLQALYGRNGESPCVVLAASTPSNCFDYAFMASKIALEHMTPVILLTDGYLANGSSAWRIPSMDEFPAINPPFVHKEMQPTWTPYLRNDKNAVRYWAFPGMEGFSHRVGGLEKDNQSGCISTVASNHQLMTDLRQAKIDAIADVIPELNVQGNPDADVLVVGWGGTFGHLYTAVQSVNKQGKKLAFAHFNYINPLPKNTEAVLKRYSTIVVCELNSGQFAGYLRSKIEGLHIVSYTKVQGQPFTEAELTEQFLTLLNNDK